MTWFTRLLSSVPGSPTMHAFVVFLGTLGFIAIAMFHIETIDPWVYVGCVGALAATASGSAYVSAQADKVVAESPPVPSPETHK